MLQNKDYCQDIKSLIADIRNCEALTTPVKKGEYLKYKICKFTISFGKNDKEVLQEKELGFTKQLNMYCNIPDPVEDEKQKILNLQSELDDNYTQRPSLDQG